MIHVKTEIKTAETNRNTDSADDLWFLWFLCLTVFHFVHMMSGVYEIHFVIGLNILQK